MSLGISTMLSSVKKEEDIIKRADAALDSAKQNERNMVETSTSEDMTA